jgi:hypothetical protein
MKDCTTPVSSFTSVTRRSTYADRSRCALRTVDGITSPFADIWIFIFEFHSHVLIEFSMLQNGDNGSHDKPSPDDQVVAHQQ